MEQLIAIVMAYSSWIFWGILVLNLILLTAALHRMRKLRKQTKQVSQDVKKLLEVSEEGWKKRVQQNLAAESELVAAGTSDRQQINEGAVLGVLAAEENVPINDYIRGGKQDLKAPAVKSAETPENLLNAVLEEVFP